MIAELFVAYHRTTYSAETPLGPIELRVEKPNGVLVQLLKQYRATTWAYVTAFNPGSQTLAKDENRRRQHQLEDSLRREELPFFRGAGVGDDPQWPPEESVLVLNITRSRACELAREFGQNAILAGSDDGMAEIIDCRSSAGPLARAEQVGS